MPAVSVVITAYQLEMCMACCLDELLKQTMQDFDILVVDDCSKDQTADIVRDYQARYPEKIRALILPCNTGSPARARNAALNSGLIDGTYVLFLDGDDHIEADFLEAMLSAAERNDADMVLCRYDRIDVKTGRVLCRELSWLDEAICLPPKNDDAGFLNSALWNKLIRAEKIADLRLPDFRVGEDLCFSLRVLSNCQRVACVPRELIHYAIWNGSVMTSTRAEDGQAFANELSALYHAADANWKEIFALVSFLHIGLSIPSRMAIAREQNLRMHIQNARMFMQREFDFYRHSRYLKLRSLAKRGIKGVSIWLCLAAYRCNLFLPALRVYLAASRLLKIEVKF